jgi:hypothetical protein
MPPSAIGASGCCTDRCTMFCTTGRAPLPEMTPTSGARCVVAGGAGARLARACGACGGCGLRGTGPMNGGATGPMNGALDGCADGGRTTGTTTGADDGEGAADREGVADRDGAADGDGDGEGEVCLLCDGGGALVAAGDGVGEDQALGDRDGRLGRPAVCVLALGLGLGDALGDALGGRVAAGLALPLPDGAGRFVNGAAAAALSTASVAEPASRSTTSHRVRAAGSTARLIPLRRTSSSRLALVAPDPQHVCRSTPEFPVAPYGLVDQEPAIRRTGSPTRTPGPRARRGVRRRAWGRARRCGAG